MEMRRSSAPAFAAGMASCARAGKAAHRTRAAIASRASERDRCGCCMTPPEDEAERSASHPFKKVGCAALDYSARRGARKDAKIGAVNPRLKRLLPFSLVLLVSTQAAPLLHAAGT